MAFISSSPPPMMPDDEDIEDLDEFGGHLDDADDEDSAAFDLTGKLKNHVNFDTKSAFVYFQACLQNSKAFPKKPYRWLPRKLSCQPMDSFLWKTP